MRRYLGMLVYGGDRRVTPGAPPPIWRRLFHVVAGSSIPLAAIFIPETALIWALAVLAAQGLVLDLVRFRVGWLNSLFIRWLAPLLKEDEEAHITGATYMLIAALIVFVLYGKEVGIPVMFFLSLGDPAAAIVGRRMPGPRILGKSPGGTAAFIAVGAGAVAVLIAADGIHHHWALWVGAGVAGMVELISLPPDDNLSIPLLAGTALFLLGL
jgi:dolichol kinase